MIDFMAALADPDIPFLRYALITGILSSIAFGIIGPYVVARRISYIAAAISHSILGGVGVAIFLRSAWGWEWLTPMQGGSIWAMGVALLAGLVILYGRQREETIIGAVWVISMAIGLLFLSRAPGYHDPMSYLFGDILLITKADVWRVVILDLLVVGLGVGLYNRLMAVCFDEEFARVRGVRVNLYFLLLLCLTALTVALLVNVVGIVMVIALLTIPPAIAGAFSHRMWQLMVYSILFCMIVNTLGLAVSYIYNLPTGPTIIALAGAAYLVVIVGKRVVER